jgi:hypothetical protein
MNDWNHGLEEAAVSVIEGARYFRSMLGGFDPDSPDAQGLRDLLRDMRRTAEQQLLEAESLPVSAERDHLIELLTLALS